MNLKIDFSKLLNDLIIPLISLTLILVLFFVFINPYLTLSRTFKTDKPMLEKETLDLSLKKDILTRTKAESEKLRKYESVLNSLVPNDANASDLVGVLDILSRATNFSTVEENKNIVSNENSKKRLNEVKFNGKTTGMTSAVTFIEKVTSYPTKIFNINKLEITKNFDDKFTRVSFSALSAYNPDKAVVNVDSPVVDYLNDKDFLAQMEKLISN